MVPSFTRQTPASSPAPSLSGRGTPAPIYVTKPALPCRKALYALLDGVWERGWLTNNGPLAQQLTEQLKLDLESPYFTFLSNGTVAIQLAIRSLRLTGSILTSPLSYVATPNAIALEGLQPVFVDVDPQTLCIDPAKLEAALRPDTSAILGVHVYGRPCAVEAIDAFAKTHGLAVIYDAAHAFGSVLDDRPLATYGDAATLSFHATKVFNTVEGGGIIMHSAEGHKDISYLHAHGHIADDFEHVGYNAKNSELHAAVGLLNLPDVPAAIAARKQRHDLYAQLLRDTDGVEFIASGEAPNFQYNYAYAPMLCGHEERLLRIVRALESENVFPRRYFYPALNMLPQFGDHQSCPIAERIAVSVLCLPLYPDLALSDVKRICKTINRVAQL